MPPSVARRIDRLARRAHAFHRWSHHPLCDAYASDRLRVGRRARLCRGCALATAGALAGLAAGLLAPPLPGAIGLALTAALLALAPVAVRRAPAATPTAARRRLPKLLTRLAPTAVAGAALGQALAAPSPARSGAAILGGAAVGWALLRYRRRGPDRAACAGCPEAPPGPRCAGFAPVFRRERALSRLAGRWIAAALPVPPGAVTPRPPPPPASPAPSWRPPSSGT